jgi:hypothetical protein
MCSEMLTGGVTVPLAQVLCHHYGPPSFRPVAQPEDYAMA